MPAVNETVDPAQRSHLLRRPPIVLTNSDRDSLLALLRTAVTDMEPDVARFLREELERADIVSGEVSPTAVVSIGSAVKFIDHAAMKIRQVKLVLPDEANEVDLISVTAALGSALVGLGPGQTITWLEGQTKRQIAVLATSLPDPDQHYE
ncbi:MAG TPA: GreA/GreB family elongation factor [Xanthobacteraceae bacterium]|nr:GreA/GreB family elongation factor [Xanthobacteraceae bacterium]